jgi:hypothetical protein
MALIADRTAAITAQGNILANTSDCDDISGWGLEFSIIIFSWSMIFLIDAIKNTTLPFRINIYSMIQRQLNSTPVGTKVGIIINSSTQVIMTHKFLP